MNDVWIFAVKMYKVDIHCGRWCHYDVTFVWL